MANLFIVFVSVLTGARRLARIQQCQAAIKINKDN
jgi:hypothetical protein